MSNGRKKGHIVTEATRKKLRLANLGKKHKLETRQKMSETHKKIGTGKHLKGKHNSPRTEFKKGLISNENHPNWKGGISKTRGYQNFYIRLNKAKRRGASGSYSMKEWGELKLRFNYMCLCCKKHEPEIKLTVDHIIPISKGGTNDISNIQPLCSRCNSIKNSKYINYMPEIVLGKIG